MGISPNHAPKPKPKQTRTIIPPSHIYSKHSAQTRAEALAMTTKKAMAIPFICNGFVHLFTSHKLSLYAVAYCVLRVHTLPRIMDGHLHQVMSALVSWKIN